MGSEDEGSNFVFRELLQNADDVKSTMLVLRFEEDALYVANDGRQFSSNDDILGNVHSDFTRITEVLARYQEEDKETVGHFGSGFQTVYMITFSPEIHSSGHSKQLNPFINKLVDAEKKRKSPFSLEAKGVLFRFPWRTKEELDREPRKVNRDWETWDRDKRLKFFDDLRRYVHQAILCCQHLTMIRLIWHEKDNYEGFQVIRDFALRNEDEFASGKSFSRGSVKAGRIEREPWRDEWNDSFQKDGWHFTPESRSFQYLIGRTNVTADEKRLFLVRNIKGIQEVTTDKIISTANPLKRGDVFVIFPLFDVTQAFDCDGEAYLYSVIPLPGRGNNRFIFSAHFWPTEDRKDVDVDGAHGDWYRAIMQNVLDLYESQFSVFLKEINSIQMLEEERQKIILNNIPNSPLSEWMRPSKERNYEWIEKSRNWFNKLIENLWEKPILFTNDTWNQPIHAVWTDDDTEKEAYEILGAKTFTDDFLSHPHVESSFKELLEKRRSNAPYFMDLFSSFAKINQNKSGLLVYGQRLEHGQNLDRKSIEALIRYCIIKEDISSSIFEEVAVVPGADGVLRNLKDYPVLPKELTFLYSSLPDSEIIHKDFKSDALEHTREKRVPKTTPEEIVKLIDRMVQGEPQRFNNLNPEDHLTLSRILKILVEDLDWKPNDQSKTLKFIPFKKGEILSVGTLNTRKEKDGSIEWIGQSSHLGEKYQRDFIFGASKKEKEIPGLTPEVEARIKFLSLTNCNEVTSEKIEDTLGLVKLMPKGTPTNFVRHFLSPKEPGSLFVDKIIQDFLGIEKNGFDNQKKQFQKALKLYFAPRNQEDSREEAYLTAKDMGKVPSLYDEEGKWHNAEDFALNVEPEVSILRMRSLHPDLLKWEKDTLIDLGVKEAPTATIVAQKLLEIIPTKEEHRKDICSLIYYLLGFEVKIEDEFQDFESRTWVPTIDGGFRKPGEVLIPNSENKKVLGEDYGSFLDLSSFASKLVDKKVSENTFESRAKSLGIKSEISLPVLVSLIKQKRKQEQALSTEFFDLITRKVRDNPAEAHDLIFGEDIGYYYNGKWVKSRKIRLIDKEKLKEIPQGVKDILIILDKDTHREYLLRDGANDHIEAKDFLDAIVQGKLQPTPAIWDEVSALTKSECELSLEDDEPKYGTKPIYPDGENKRALCPKNIIYVDKVEDTIFFSEGTVGNIHVIGYERSRSHANALAELGARKSSELDVKSILGLIRKFKEEELDIDRTSRVLRLILKLAQKSMERFPDEPLWPATKDERYLWVAPRNAYVNDSSFSEHFKTDLSFVCAEIDGKGFPDLEKYAIRSGAKSFSKMLNKRGTIETPGQNDNRTTSILNEAETILSEKFNRIPDQCFQWLASVEVKKCENIEGEYFIDNFVKRIKEVVLFDSSSSSPIFLVNSSSDQESQKEKITDEIVKECIRRGFPEEERQNLSYFLLQFLHRNQDEWSKLVPRYKPKVVIDSPTPPCEPTTFPWITSDEEKVFRFEMTQGGWKETRDKLHTLYESCQICGARTPFDENNPYDTSEGVKRIVCEKGGRYHGPTKSFSEKNSVFLCPTHHTLWFRGLVKFDFLEEPSVENIEAIKQKIKDTKEIAKTNPGKEITPLECYIFSAKSKIMPERTSANDWEPKEITFKAKHAAGFLETMREYLENKRRETSH